MSTVLHPALISLVSRGAADEVIAPAYDASSPAYRSAVLAEHPLSYLGVTRSPEDFPTATAPSTDALIAQNRAALERLLAAGVFDEPTEPTMYLYRLIEGDHAQTGIVCEVDVDDYRSGRIRTHEGIRPSRAALLERHLDEVRASSSPVALTLPMGSSLGELFDSLTVDRPALDNTAQDGIRQVVWRLDREAVAEIGQLVRPDSLVVVDGHHRLAAAASLSARRLEPSFHRVLVVVYPPEQLQVFAFHRHVADPTPNEIERLERLAVVETLDEDRPPLERGSFGLYRDGVWSRMTPVDRPEPTAPVERLDVVSLHRDLLDPAFGLGVASNDPRLETVAGPTGRAELEERVDQIGGLGFGLAPITIEELFAVAEQDAPMPAKSSFFWPKARSGVFLRMR